MELRRVNMAKARGTEPCSTAWGQHHRDPHPESLYPAYPTSQVSHISGLHIPASSILRLHIPGLQMPGLHIPGLQHPGISIAVLHILGLPNPLSHIPHLPHPRSLQSWISSLGFSPSCSPKLSSHHPRSEPFGPQHPSATILDPYIPEEQAQPLGHGGLRAKGASWAEALATNTPSPAASPFLSPYCHDQGGCTHAVGLDAMSVSPSHGPFRPHLATCPCMEPALHG